MNVYKYHFGLGDRVSRPTPWPTPSFLRQLSLAQEENPRNGKESSQTLSPVPSLGGGRIGQRSWEAVSLLQALQSGAIRLAASPRVASCADPFLPGRPLASPQLLGSLLGVASLPPPPALTASSPQAPSPLLPGPQLTKPPAVPSWACPLGTCTPARSAPPPRPLPRLPVALPSRSPSPAPCSPFCLGRRGFSPVSSCLPWLLHVILFPQHTALQLALFPFVPCLAFPSYLSHSWPSLCCCLLVFLLVSRYTAGLFLIPPSVVQHKFIEHILCARQHASPSPHRAHSPVGRKAFSEEHWEWC